MPFNLYQNGDSSASSMAATASSPSGNPALHLQNQLQESVATDNDIIVKPGMASKSTGQRFYDSLILKYQGQYQLASTPEQKRSIVQAVANAYHYNYSSSNQLHQKASRQRLRRFLKPKSDDPSRLVELGDEEISKKINLAFHRQEVKTKRRLGKETISPRHRQQQKIPSGHFVPKFAKGTSPEKQQFRQQEDGHHSQQHRMHFQQKLMNQHNNTFQHGRLCRGVEQQQELKQEPKISQLFESMRRKDDPEFLAQKNPSHRLPKLEQSTGTKMKPKETTKSKKVVPVRKKQPKAKNRILQQGISETIPVAAKKPPPPSASSTTPETAQKVVQTPKIINASSASTTKEELDMAASVMMELTLAPTPSLPKIYPIGTRTKKFFNEFDGWFQGTIRSYNQDTKFYSVEYEDGDTEDLEHHEIDTGSLPPHKYDIGTQFEIYFVSKQSGEKIGWFVGKVRSKYYNDPKQGNRQQRKTWRYNVVYSDGESEDVDEDYITQTIKESKQQRDKQVVESPVKTFEEEQESHEEDSDEETDESSSEEEDEDEDSSLEDEQEDPNPENIPYWTGKQHHQFLVGLQKYGLGNLEDIHEANCIPDRSFQELVRYWEWYASDMEAKGLVLNYDRRGTVNGKKGNREGIQEDSTMEEKKDDIHEEEKKEEPQHETNAAGFYTGIWTDAEKEMVVKAFVFQGSSYRAMSDYMKTRSPQQIASYYNNNKKKIVDASKKYADEMPLFVPPVNKGSKSKAKTKPWTPGAHDLLVEAVAIYGKKIKEIETYMKCRTQKQIAGYLKRQKGSFEKEIQDKKQLLKKKFPKKTNTWTSSELSMLVEGHAIFENDYERIADYVKTRSEDQVKSLLKDNPSQYEDESAFDLGDHFSFPIELYHVLNVAPFEGFDHIISWNDEGDCVLIHDNVEFSNTVFPRYSHKGTPLQKFYDNLELYGFKPDKDEKSKADEAFRQSAFQKGDYKKVEQYCQKAHIAT